MKAKFDNMIDMSNENTIKIGLKIIANTKFKNLWKFCPTKLSPSFVQFIAHASGAQINASITIKIYEITAKMNEIIGMSGIEI